MYESADIVKYLWKEYGSEATPFIFDHLGSLPILNLGLFVASAFRILPHRTLMIYVIPHMIFLAVIHMHHFCEWHYPCFFCILDS